MGRKTKSVILFDESSRKDFVLGAQKRNVDRRKMNKEKFEEQLKKARKKVKQNARETYRKIINPLTTTEPDPVLFEKQYELPSHSVKVQELCMNEIAKKNNWIGENKVKLVTDENIEDVPKKRRNSDLDELPGMSSYPSSIKEIKKIINEQSKSMIQCDRIFRKKNKLEKIINKKRAARKKRLLEKERKKLKGRKRK